MIIINYRNFIIGFISIFFFFSACDTENTSQNIIDQSNGTLGDTVSTTLDSTPTVKIGNRFTCKTSLDLDSDGDIDEATNIYYNDLDLIIEELVCQSREFSFFCKKINYTYSNSSKIILKETISVDTDDLLSVIAYLYDSFDNLVKEDNVYGNNSSTKRYIYNQLNQLIQENAELNGNLEFIIYYFYNPFGDLIRREKDSSADSTTDITTIYTYLSEFLILDETYDRNGELLVSTEYMYNDSGKIQKIETKYNNSGLLVSTEWYYDHLGRIETKIEQSNVDSLSGFSNYREFYYYDCDVLGYWDF